jgi:hypothetical protein
MRGVHSLSAAEVIETVKRLCCFFLDLERIDSIRVLKENKSLKFHLVKSVCLAKVHRCVSLRYGQFDFSGKLTADGVGKNSKFLRSHL